MALEKTVNTEDLKQITKIALVLRSIKDCFSSSICLDEMVFRATGALSVLNFKNRVG